MTEPLKSFMVRCPNGHQVYPAFHVEELRASLADGSAKFFCMRCGQNWPLSSTEQANLQGWLDETPE